MRILLLADSLVAGGTERRLVELIKGLGEYPSIDLRLVVFSDKIHYSEIHDLGITIDIIRRKPKRNPIVFYKVFRICRQWKPDLIHSWGTMSSFWAIPSILLLRIKLINGNIVNSTPNLGFFNAVYFRAKLTFPFSKVIVSNSKAGLDAYRVPKRKGRCINNGFDLRRISDLREETALKNDLKINTKNVIGMVGRFVMEKDYNTFFKAAIKILEQRRDVTFIAVGSGPTLEACQAMIPSEYQDLCIFAGYQKDVESIVNIFTIGVLSMDNKLHGEGISNAILEYMAMGKPVVATSGGGTNEIVLDRETGFLLPENSPEALAERLTHLLDNPDEAETLGMNGKKRIEEHFSLNKMTKEYIDLYSALLA